MGANAARIRLLHIRTLWTLWTLSSACANGLPYFLRVKLLSCHPPEAEKDQLSHELYFPGSGDLSSFVVRGDTKESIWVIVSHVSQCALAYLISSELTNYLFTIELFLGKATLGVGGDTDNPK